MAALVVLTGVVLASAASEAIPAAGSSGGPGVGRHGGSRVVPVTRVAPTPHRYRPDGSGLRMGLHCQMVPALS